MLLDLSDGERHSSLQADSILDWIILGMGLLIDIASYTSSERGWQQRQATVV